MLCKLETRPQLSRFVCINAIAFKSFLVRMIKNHFYSSSQQYFTCVVEYSLNQFPCHRHVFVKTVNKQISHVLQSRSLPIRISPISKIFIFRGSLPSEKVEGLISVSFQVSECYCELLYHKVFRKDFPQVFPTRRG